MNKLERLHQLREKAGIVFNKSFNCEEAEKNIHLVDKDKFFEKFVKKLKDMGYEPSKDFTFDIIRHKCPYAERHHFQKTFEWKYFYSTTFEITDEMIDFLERHLFIKKKIDSTNSKKEDSEIQKRIVRQNRIKDLTASKEKNIAKLEKFYGFIKSHEKLGNTGIVENYKRAVNKTKEKIKNIEKEIKELMGE